MSETILDTIAPSEYHDEETESSEKEKSVREDTENGEKLDNDAVTLQIKSENEGEESPALPLKMSAIKDFNGEPPIHIFPISRLKLAWANSSNVFEFILRVIAIAFSTLGWLCCVGGIPLMSLAMLIIGSIHAKDCNIQPNIPVYLIVSGAFGTLQHFIAVWTKYISKDSQGPMKVYRAYCKVIECTIEIFLIIWFVLGCIWVYGVPPEIDFQNSFKDEYCNKTVYYFAFWMLNVSFILLLLLVVVTLIVILCVIVSPKD